MEEGSAVGVEEESAVGSTDSKSEGVIVDGTDDDDGVTLDGTDDDDGVTVDGTDDDGLIVDGGQPMTITGLSPMTRNTGGGVQ